VERSTLFLVIAILSAGALVLYELLAGEYAAAAQAALAFLALATCFYLFWRPGP
jgi:hypothetical protein